MVRDNTKAAKRVIKTVIGIYAKNFHIIPGNNIIGRNTTRVVIVPAISGALNSFTVNKTAVRGVYQIFIFSLDHSTITIIVSSAIQRVKRREKFVKKFRLNHIISRTINVMKNASGIKIVAITHSLSHKNMNNKTKTSNNVFTQLSARSL